VGGGYITSPMWSKDQGIYWVAAAGGEPARVTRKGSRPQFGAEGDRVFLIYSTQDGEKDKHELFSIDLDGSDERTEATSENAVEYAVSPDGKWLAFVERFNAYITSFPKTGKTISVGPKMTSIPARRVSRDAGEFVHFSGDSKRLHWALGPELYTRDLKDAFAFLEGSPESLPEPPETGVNIAFKEPYDKPRGRFALIGARIITMRGDEIIDEGTIVIDGNRIVAVGRSRDLGTPSGAEVIDLKGCTIIPGLVDVHDHGPHGANGYIPEQNWSLHAKLAFGVTTVHDPSHDTKLIFSSSELARAGMIVAPRIFSTGTILYGAAGSFKAEVDSLEDAKSHLRRMQAVGAFTVKSYNQPRRDQRQQVIAAARELGMMVVPEGGALLQHNLTQVVDGHTGVEHCVPVEHVYKDVTSLWGASQAGYTPTLTVAFGGLGGENYWFAHTHVWEDEHLAAFVPPFVIDPVSRRRTLAPDNEWNHINAAGVCKAFTDAGVKVNLGAHGQMAGLAHHWELWMFAQGGMTPLEVIRAGTLNPSQYLGLDGDIGSLEAGKLADLVVLEKNPLDDIRNTATMRYVMLNGRLYDARTLDEIAPTPRKREPYFFHR
jgi:imidazolonepropionase-like amidohydrolase